MELRFNFFQQMRKSKYIKLFSLLLIIMSLPLMFSYKHVMANGDDGNGIKLKNVPPGAKLQASLDGKPSDPLAIIDLKDSAKIRVDVVSGDGTHESRRTISFGEDYELTIKLEEGHRLYESATIDSTLIFTQDVWSVPVDWDSWQDTYIPNSRSTIVLKRQSGGKFVSSVQRLELPPGSSVTKPTYIVAIFPDAETDKVQTVKKSSTGIDSEIIVEEVDANVLSINANTKIPPRFWIPRIEDYEGDTSVTSQPESKTLFIGDFFFILANPSETSGELVLNHHVSDGTIKSIPLIMIELRGGLDEYITKGLEGFKEYDSIPLEYIKNFFNYGVKGIKENYSHLSKLIYVRTEFSVNDQLRIVQSIYQPGSNINSFSPIRNLKSPWYTIKTEIEVGKLSFMSAWYSIKTEKGVADIGDANLGFSSNEWKKAERKKTTTNAVVDLAAKIKEVPYLYQQGLYVMPELSAVLSLYWEGDLIADEILHLMRYNGHNYLSAEHFYLGHAFGVTPEPGDIVVARLEAEWLLNDEEVRLEIVAPEERVASLLLKTVPVENAEGNETDTLFTDGSFRAVIEFDTPPTEAGDLVPIHIRATREGKQIMNATLFARHSKDDKNKYVSDDIALLLDDRFDEVKAGDRIEARYGEIWDWPRDTYLMVQGSNLKVESVRFVDIESGKTVEEAPIGSSVFAEVTFEALRKGDALPEVIIETQRVNPDPNRPPQKKSFELNPMEDKDLVFRTKSFPLKSTDVRHGDPTILPRFQVTASVADREIHLEVTEGKLDEKMGRVEVRTSDSFGHKSDYKVSVWHIKEEKYIISTLSNRSFDLNPGKYSISVNYPALVEFRQIVDVGAGSSLCIEVPWQELGRVRITRSPKPGLTELSYEAISLQGSRDTLSNSWCKDQGPEPKSWKNGYWRTTDFVGTGVLEVPAGSYLLDTKEEGSVLYNEKAGKSFNVVAGQQTEMILKTGTVGMSVNDYQGKQLSAQLSVVSMDGSVIPVNKSMINLRPARYNLKYSFGVTDIQRNITVQHGSQLFETIKTGRVWFDSLEKFDKAVGIVIRAQNSKDNINIGEISTGSYVDLPGGVTYTYQYMGLSDEVTRKFTVSAGEEKRIKMPKTEGYLTIILPKILGKYTEQRKWKFDIEATTSSGKRVKSKSDNLGMWLSKGDYLIHIDAYYNRPRFHVPTFMYVNPIKIHVDPDVSNDLKVPMSRLILKRTLDKDYDFTLSKSGLDINTYYLRKESPEFVIFLSPGNYLIKESLELNREWIINIPVGKSKTIQN